MKGGAGISSSLCWDVCSLSEVEICSGGRGVLAIRIGPARLDDVGDIAPVEGSGGNNVLKLWGGEW